ncbi:hypothetical protein Si118_01092 [Streptococcus infantarius subsp. infantarius]|nr:hypothetical protein [Streptococcus infantarius subsp. infantarius]
MDVQEILNRNSFLEDEVHRCYAEIKDYEVKTNWDYWSYSDT